MMMIAAQTLIDLFRQALRDKWGYIWGQSGAVRTQAKQDAATRAMTVQYGSRWIGRHVADCSGLFVWAFKGAGGSIYHGSNTIWRSYCTRKGTLTPGQTLRPGTALFLVRDGVRHHIGLYVGDDTVIEARGTRYGVVTSKVSRWDEWGELRGVDYGDGDIAFPPTLRVGDRGEDVVRLQEGLQARGYAIDADGVYGAKTKAAVKAFQAERGLKADGVCGPLTWTLLLDAPAEAPEAPDAPQAPENPQQPDAPQQPEESRPWCEECGVTALLERVAALEERVAQLEGAQNTQEDTDE